MIRHRRRQRLLAACLSGVAGYVDALGFLDLGGFFLSFMSGNSTRLGVGLDMNAAQAVRAGTLIALFVVGVVGGTLAGRFITARRQVIVLAGVALLLAVAALFDHGGMHAASIAVLVLAMGAENTVFERDGEVSVGVTYMTGTLVKLGQRVAAALLGGEPFAWAWYFMLWFGLVAGATLGALAYPVLKLQGVWIAAGAMALLALLAAFCGFPADEEGRRAGGRSVANPPGGS